LSYFNIVVIVLICCCFRVFYY